MEDNPTGNLKYGGVLIALVFAITLGFSGTTLVISIVDNVSVRLLVLRGARFLLTVILCFGLWRGKNWARCVMIFFCFSGTLAAIVVIVHYGWGTPRAMFSLGMAAVFAPLGVMLLRSSSIRGYLAWRKESISAG